MARFLVVKDYAQHQHYKDRNPPWIKLHFSTLTNYAITSLSDAAQGQLFKFWLLASRHENLIPYDAKWLKRELKVNGKLLLPELLASGLLAVREQDASTLLAPRARSREAERETETETEQRPRGADIAGGPGRTMLLDQLPVARRHAFAAKIEMLAQGIGLPPGSGVPTNAQLDAACLDVLATCDRANLSPKVLATFLAREMRGERLPHRPTVSAGRALNDRFMEPQPDDAL